MENAKKIIQEVIQEILSEGRSSYWPGLNDDGVADNVSAIMGKFTKKLNSELDGIYKKYPPAEKGEEGFWNKEFYGNVVLNFLKNGFDVPSKHVKQALKAYKGILKDPNLDEYMKESGPEFKDSIDLVVKKIEELSSSGDGEYYYKPSFMENDVDVQEVNLRHYRNRLPRFGSLNSDKVRGYLISGMSDSEKRSIIKDIYEKNVEEERENGIADKEPGVFVIRVDVNPKKSEDYISRLDEISEEELDGFLMIMLST